MSTTILTLLAVLAQAAVSPPTVDQEAKAKAQGLLREGTVLFQGGNHVGALEKFQAAYGTYPSPKILFNIGAAERNLARPVEALEAFQRFLAEAPDAPAESRTEARQAVTELMAVLGQITVLCPTDGTEIMIDSRSAGTTPLPKPVWVAPGHHQVVARHAGFGPAVEEVDVLAGSARTLNLELARPVTHVDLRAPQQERASGTRAIRPSPAATVESPAPAPTERPLTRRWWFWPAIGAATIAGVVAIVATTSGGDTDVPQTALGAQRAF